MFVKFACSYNFLIIIMPLSIYTISEQYWYKNSTCAVNIIAFKILKFKTILMQKILVENDA